MALVDRPKYWRNHGCVVVENRPDGTIVLEVPPGIEIGFSEVNHRALDYNIQRDRDLAEDQPSRYQIRIDWDMDPVQLTGMAVRVIPKPEPAAKATLTEKVGMKRPK